MGVKPLMVRQTNNLLFLSSATSLSFYFPMADTMRRGRVLEAALFSEHFIFTCMFTCTRSAAAINAFCMYYMYMCMCMTRVLLMSSIVVCLVSSDFGLENVSSDLPICNGLAVQSVHMEVVFLYTLIVQCTRVHYLFESCIDICNLLARLRHCIAQLHANVCVNVHVYGCGLAAGRRQSGCCGENKGKRRLLCYSNWRSQQPQAQECKSR